MSSKAAVASLIVLCVVGACMKGDLETVDTTTIPGVDTTKGRAMPTTDTVVRTTITDTIQGEVPRDSVKAGTKTKAGTKRPY